MHLHFVLLVHTANLCLKRLNTVASHPGNSEITGGGVNCLGARLLHKALHKDSPLLAKKNKNWQVTSTPLSKRLTRCLNCVYANINIIFFYSKVRPRPKDLYSSLCYIRTGWSFIYSQPQRKKVPITLISFPVSCLPTTPRQSFILKVAKLPTV